MTNSKHWGDGYDLFWERVQDLEEFDHSYLISTLGGDAYDKFTDDEIDQIYSGYRAAFNKLMSQAWRFDD